MIADLSKLSLNSHFFAELICREEAMDEFKDGILYVITNNMSAWKDSIEKTKLSIKNSRIRSLWHMDYGVERLDDTTLFTKDEGLMSYFSDGANMLMPIYTPDRNGKCYFIGTIDKAENIEAAFGILSGDAQKISDECSFAAFVNSAESNTEEARRLWLRLIDYNSRSLASGGHQVSFRGKYNQRPSDVPFLGGDYGKAFKKINQNYSDFLRSIDVFSDTIEAFAKKPISEVADESKKDFVALCHGLDDSEKNELILELAKRIEDKEVLTTVLDTVIRNRGKDAKLKVKILRKTDKKKEDSRRKKGFWQTYLVDDSGKAQCWLDFEPVAHVVYVLNLIQKHTKPEILSSVNLANNKRAFVYVYELLYDKDDGEKQYESIIPELKRGEPAPKTPQLHKCYNIIANCVNTQCTMRNVSPSPYVTTLKRPLTIDKDLIELPEIFREIDVLK